MAETRREVGVRLFEEFCGAPAAAAESEFVDLTIEHIFGEVWSRQDIANRDQRLLTIAVLTTLGEWEPCAIHMRMALDSGDLSEEELHGAVIVDRRPDEQIGSAVVVDVPGAGAVARGDVPGALPTPGDPP